MEHYSSSVTLYRIAFAHARKTVQFFEQGPEMSGAKRKLQRAGRSLKWSITYRNEVHYGLGKTGELLGVIAILFLLIISNTLSSKKVMRIGKYGSQRMNN